MASAVRGLDTLIFEEDWTDALQEQLDEPTKWKDFANVIFTDSYVVNNPYHTDPSVSTYNRGTPYSYATMTQTNESITINNSRVVVLPIDEADMAQSTYADAMTWAKRIGVVLDEAIEQFIYDDHPEWTNFTAADIPGGGSGSITVSSTNVDDILRGLLREIRQASGQSLLERNGAFVVWHPGDFEQLEAFAMANGYNLADKFLENGAGGVKGVYYGGLFHYTSNLLRGGRCLAGVKKAISVYIVRETYGKIKLITEDPNNQAGIAIRGRVDFDATVWNNLAPVVFDVATTATS